MQDACHRRNTHHGQTKPTSSDNGSPDSTGSVFSKWQKKFSRMTGLGLSEDERKVVEAERAAELSEEQFQTCEKWKADLLRHSPLIRFLSQHLEASGCAFSRRHFICQPCDPTRSGGFSPEHGVVLCENRLYSKSHLEETMAHEMIHALDHCRAKLDWDNCLHHACTEIRAANLSGDCRWSNEWMRGNMAISKQQQACVRRRAILSLRSNPKCSAPGAAEEAVAEVWNSCFNDTWPFDEVYR
ncbi:peptidase M76 family-domain-containing protein [Catenaria anguillulae PL171]|uniref:Mitochondrial inner membrane protease ATP23 n=1 Tax=Catenaria anguillulae PL171 TaxID=765915 RepID=A0A1Y2HU47_9FUNG|nr:peptidase M76 family-domain-containing protein [Catenaria anguillulae PL171]